ncbi:uncharacterized protein MONOS_8967 [Monocercomonoides exilis]|uniref:uncharacterized protein n=1 Tax=Monocercomonoides exilis TaxID=2049356 RepID=UPI00355A047E|nr:hypothetical protein MONOS_8967 [Monocercomonoides exilis]|eukprot:MONOS_8967.1-p1 / transcript=MONOS_8967.1 / gene=MONOS_8967 / organism=Monocercomonoides_exilis_PA203 / gene_product=unspecified product / transcript_product=unspecified product / location=Mono_scaffold00354:14224-16577(-) / protein_length=766 / sequence_SO=supercontig / SO=protein_coding / is_pseudo=false
MLLFLIILSSIYSKDIWYIRMNDGNDENCEVNDQTKPCKTLNKQDEFFQSETTLDIDPQDDEKHILPIEINKGGLTDFTIQQSEGSKSLKLDEEQKKPLFSFKALKSANLVKCSIIINDYSAIYIEQCEVFSIKGCDISGSWNEGTSTRTSALIVGIDSTLNLESINEDQKEYKTTIRNHCTTSVAGIELSQGSSATIKGATFTHLSGKNGGALKISNDAKSINLESTKFENCDAVEGGAIYWEVDINSPVHTENAIAHDNHEHNLETYTLTDCDFLQNKADNGGGICVLLTRNAGKEADFGTKIRISGSHFSSNTANKKGGGLYVVEQINNENIRHKYFERNGGMKKSFKKNTNRILGDEATKAVVVVEKTVFDENACLSTHSSFASSSSARNHLLSSFNKLAFMPCGGAVAALGAENEKLYQKNENEDETAFHVHLTNNTFSNSQRAAVTVEKGAHVLIDQLKRNSNVMSESGVQYPLDISCENSILRMKMPEDGMANGKKEMLGFESTAPSETTSAALYSNKIYVAPDSICDDVCEQHLNGTTGKWFKCSAQAATTSTVSPRTMLSEDYPMLPALHLSGKNYFPFNPHLWISLDSDESPLFSKKKHIIVPLSYKVINPESSFTALKSSSAPSAPFSLSESSSYPVTGSPYFEFFMEKPVDLSSLSAEVPEKPFVYVWVNIAGNGSDSLSADMWELNNQAINIKKVDEDNKPKLSVGAIVGIAIGGVAALGILIGVFVCLGCWLKKRKIGRKDAEETNLLVKY